MPIVKTKCIFPISSESEEEYVPEHCSNEQCVTLLSSRRHDTDFVIEHIDQLKLYVKIVWFGENLSYVVQKLYDQNMKKSSAKRKSFIVVHWTPSEIVDANIEYESIALPKCEEFLQINRNAMCKYELMPILMYCSKKFMQERPIFDHVFGNIDINFDQANEKYLLKLYNNLTDVRQRQPDNGNIVGIENASNHADDKEHIYDEIACEFLRDLSETSEMKKQIQFIYSEIAKRPKQQIFIGGIYPKKEEQENEHNGEILLLL